MIRLLLYGGCHAQILRDCLVAAFDPKDLSADLLINFELIRREEPFPIERLVASDAVIFSPIENKGDYNTENLVEACRRHGKLAICFPWLEWHGYCPGAHKGLFKSRHQWYYPKLLELASSFDDFASFRAYALAHFPDDDVIDRTMRQTTAWLAASEERHATQVRLSPFIEEHYRRSRLFLISDHPSRLVYAHILKQVLDQLGLPFRDDMIVDEPQWQWRTPIFPRVRERLGLAFDDEAWADDMLLPGGLSNLETYLGLYFRPDAVVLGPMLSAELKASFHRPFRVDATTRLLAAPIDPEAPPGPRRYEFLETLAGPAIDLNPGTPITIDSQQWRQTWDI